MHEDKAGGGGYVGVAEQGGYHLLADAHCGVTGAGCMASAVGGDWTDLGLSRI